MTGCDWPSIVVTGGSEYGYTPEECVTLELRCVDDGTFTFLPYGDCKCVY